MPEIKEKILELYNILGEVIWWTKVINNPIYTINAQGEREARDLFEIRDGFLEAYYKFSKEEEKKNG